MLDAPSTLNPAVRAHIESFYRSADSETAVEEWTNHFTPDGMCKKSPDEVKGRADLQKYMASSWATVASREHVVYRVYPFEDGTEEVMLHGRTDVKLKDGCSKRLVWGARLKFAKNAETGGVLIHRYTILSDPTPASEDMLAA